MTVPGRKVQTEIPRSEVEFKNYVLVDFFTTVLKNHMFQAFFFLEMLYFFMFNIQSCL